MNPYELTELASLFLVSQFPERQLRHPQQLRDLLSFSRISKKFYSEIIPTVLSLIESLSEELIGKIGQSEIRHFLGLRELVIHDYLGELRDFRNLESLEIHSGGYSDLGKMSNLKSLSLSLIKKPQHLDLLGTLTTTLTKLDLSGCKSKKFLLPESLIKVETFIRRMTQIENLTLYYCNIIHDQHLLYLTNLKFLDLSCINRITCEALSKMTMLTDLSIREMV